MKGPTRWEWMQAVLSADGPQGGASGRDAATGPVVRLTLAALGQHMDPSGGSCYPSIPLLAEETKMGERTVRRALQQAEVEGWIRRETRGRGYLYIPAVPAGVAGNGKRPHRPESPKPDAAPIPAAPAGVGIPAAPATVAAPAAGPRPLRPPSSTREVVTTQPSPSSPVYPTIPPTSPAQRREDVAHLDRGEIRRRLRNACLLGDDQGTLPDGTVVGIGLLLVQFDELASLIDPETLLVMVELVRYQPAYAPGPFECFTLALVRKNLGDLESEARRRTPARPVTAGVELQRLPHARPEDFGQP